MKIVQQKRLYFNQGNSDKVYEVDLLETTDDLFIVNFRYGRRGAVLRDGTKTVFPLPHDEALKIFDQLVSSKVKKGYSENFLASSETPIPKTAKKSENTAREKTILKYLDQATKGLYTRDWKLSRIIWRAAVLNIESSAELISNFIESDDEFEQYAAINALIKFENADYTERVLNQFKLKGFESKVGRIAASYILKYGPSEDKRHVLNASEESTPKFLRQDNLLANLSFYYMKDQNFDGTALYHVYLTTHNDKIKRRTVLSFIENVPFKVNTFKSIRYIYRHAFLIGDMPTFAMISKRIAISPSGFQSNYVHSDGKYISADVEKMKPNPSIAFSSKTKHYFNVHTYKLTQQLSTDNEDAYIDLAKNVLVALDYATDNQKIDHQVTYEYDFDTRNYNAEERYYPRYANYLTLLYILYGKSNRFKKSKSSWFYNDVIEFKDLPREEPLAELWNNKPEAVLFILAHAKSEEAVYFALRILKDNPSMLQDIASELLEKLIMHKHPEVFVNIIASLEAKFNNAQAPASIIQALLKSENDTANTIGFKWLKQYESDYFSSPQFVTELLGTANIEVISYLENLYKDNVPYSLELNITSLNLLLSSESNFAFDYLIAVNRLIGNTHFGKLFSSVEAKDIQELSKSGETVKKLFAANLAKHNNTSAYILFKDSIDGYIDSGSEQLREAGIELLSHFPDTYLTMHSRQIVSYLFSEYPEVRAAIRPSVLRLTDLDADFKEDLLLQLLDNLSTAEAFEGMHQNTYGFLVDTYGSELATLNNEMIFGLILSEYEFAQKLGTPLFYDRISLHDLSMDQVVKLSHSHVFDIRNSLETYFLEHKDRVNYELETALRVFNSPWSDVIKWAMDFFRTHIETQHWTPDLLLYVCDHTKSEVQSFGRELMLSHFTNDKGLPMLLKLQEHPSKDMQFFVSSFLSQYAASNEEVILSLESYFRTSLFNINTNRTTKTRVFDFLQNESQKNKSVAEMTVRILSDILGTKTLVDQSYIIDVLLDINEKHPEIDVPITINALS